MKYSAFFEGQSCAVNNDGWIEMYAPMSGLAMGQGSGGIAGIQIWGWGH